MRYSVMAKGLSIDEVQIEVQRCGGKNLKVAARSGQVFCELDENGYEKLVAVPGLAIKKLGGLQHQQISSPYLPMEDTVALQPIFGSSQLSLSSLIYDLRESTSPAATGQGWTIAVLDSGIRKTHYGLVGKVVHEANFSDSPTAEDNFSHGTGVAFVAAGGRHAAGEECGLAPGAKLMNIKILNDDGYGTMENAILGIEHVQDLVEQAQNQGLSPDDPMYPNIINMSWGTEDDGDPDNPLRVALEEAAKSPLGLYASAGNTGPGAGTIMLPASMPEVWAAGAVTLSPFGLIWSASSRGPTLDGLVKPDLVFFGVNILTASGKGDNEFEVKSGTSFACPGAAGGGALLVQIFNAYGLIPNDQVYNRIEPENMLAMLALMCRKPEGSPVAKDNDYGVGHPFGDLILRVAGSTVNSTGEIVEMATPLLGIGLMAGLVSSMAR